MFIPQSGVTHEDLEALADRLIGTNDGLEDHINSLGLYVYSVIDLLDDLELGGYLIECGDCGVWCHAKDVSWGMCFSCEFHDEDDGFDDDDFDDDGFDDDGFDDDDFDDEDDILDDSDTGSLYNFDETDEEDL